MWGGKDLRCGMDAWHLPVCAAAQNCACRVSRAAGWPSMSIQATNDELVTLAQICYITANSGAFGAELRQFAGFLVQIRVHSVQLRLPYLQLVCT